DALRRPADRRALQVGRTVDARPGAVLRQVADALGGPALDVRRVVLVRRAVVVHAVALLGDVADPGRRATLRRALRVGRARDARPGAVLRRVADALGPAALDVGWVVLVGRAVVVHAVAGLDDV